MKIKRYLDEDMRKVLRRVREDQGPDAVILSNRRTADGIELIAAVDYDESIFQQAVGLRTSATDRPGLMEIPDEDTDAAAVAMRPGSDLELASSKLVEAPVQCVPTDPDTASAQSELNDIPELREAVDSADRRHTRHRRAAPATQTLRVRSARSVARAAEADGRGP